MNLAYFLRLLFICAFINLNAQGIKMPNSGSNSQKIVLLILQEKKFGTDTLSLRNYLQPLQKFKTNTHISIYNALLANGYKNCYDSTTKRSTELYQKSIAQAIVSKDKPLLIWTRLNYVKYLYQYRHYQDMQPVLLELMEDIRKTKEVEIILPEDTYKTIGWIMQTLSDYSEADYYLKLALKHCKPNTSEHAALLDSYGINLHKTGHYNNALKQFNKAGIIALKAKDSLRYAKTLGNKAIIYEEQKIYAKSISLLKEDIALSEHLKDSKNRMFATIALARVYLKNNALTEAETALNQAGEIAVSKSYFQKSELEVIKLKLDLLKRKPDSAQELTVSRRLMILQDSLKKTDSDEQIHLLKWQIQKAKYQQKLSQTNNLYKKELTKKNIFALLIGLSILIAILIHLFQKKKHKKDKHLYEKKVKSLESEKTNIEQTLHTTNESLNNQITYVKSTNQQIKKLKTEIEVIKSSTSHYLEEESGKLRALLDSHLMTDQNWLSFKREFEREYSEFTKELAKEYPGLTDSNLRIVYLQKLGFSTTEISESLGITPEAIKKSKQRLKKKLGKKFDKLSDFIQK